MPHALIQDGVVVNVVSAGQPLEDMVECPAEVECGWLAHEAGGGAWAFEAPPPPPAPEPPALADLQGDAQLRVIASIDAATSAILNAYPRAERLGWDAKAAEAAAVLAAGGSATLSLAPLLVVECAAEYGAADNVARLAQLTAKAGTVAAKATAWGELMATLSGLRGRAFAAIGAAEDEAGVQAALEAALEEIAGAAEAAA